ncbi:MAG: cytochrome c oxidase subunit II [Bdellovibrionaceae bacterium]|nr:cytochrome c oxidase subunit II [Pseudobdellovibrionaceae bacterium]|tara:strand:+ start:68309 stop:69298 length:990 start_codon:yes stop_codon:yes gene_type:complete
MLGLFNFIDVANAQSTFMPVAGSAVAAQVDDLYAFLLICSAISCALVIGGLIYFAVKYRRQGEDDKTPYISHNSTLEFLWSFIPFCIFMVVFAWGWFIYHQMRTFPEDSLEVHVYGQKWNWEFQYKSGKKTGGTNLETNATSKDGLYVPVNTPVKLIMTSRDVLHSFYIPGLRIKQDVIPGRYTALGFVADKEGEYQVFCTEYCGDQHSAMMAKVHVVPKQEFEEWLKVNDDALPLPELGQKVFGQKCSVCHNVDTSRKIGPGLAGIFGASREFNAGAGITADENYIRESILYPNKKIVKGFPAAMTPFQGLLSERELTGLIEYIKTLN